MESLNCMNGVRTSTGVVITSINVVDLIQWHHQGVKTVVGPVRRCGMYVFIIVLLRSVITSFDCKDSMRRGYVYISTDLYWNRKDISMDKITPSEKNAPCIIVSYNYT